jgi:signal transduction histidine kinase
VNHRQARQGQQVQADGAPLSTFPASLQDEAAQQDSAGPRRAARPAWIATLRRSMRFRLAAIALVGTVMSSLAGGWLMYRGAWDQNEMLHDQMMADLGRTILRFAQHELLEIQADPSLAGSSVAIDSGVNLDSRYRFQIYGRDGKMLLRSGNASPSVMLASAGQLGFGHTFIDGEEYCTYVFVSPLTGMHIQIAALEKEREAAMQGFGTGTAVLFAGTFLPLFLCLLLALVLATRPISATARQVARRGPNDLQRLDESRVPVEIRPMTTALNGLLERIDQAIQRERQFNAVAAHEMRTPLAALRMQAQVALRARDEQQRNDALKGLVSGVDRCAYLIEQLLTLARVDASVEEPAPTEAVDLPEVVEEVLADLGSELDRRHIDVRLHLGAVHLQGRRFGLRTMLANLVGNAVRYAPYGGVVSIEAAADAEGVTLLIDDSGQGIPPAERERVFDRFRRLQHDASGGVGLGLSIVKSVAQAHRAIIQLLDSPLGGLRVRVRFPAVS